jgi:hypothetical protein
MTPIRLGMLGPTIEIRTRAKISGGIDINTSTARENTSSNHPPSTAAEMPEHDPTTNEARVVNTAMLVVFLMP